MTTLGLCYKFWNYCFFQLKKITNSRFEKKISLHIAYHQCIEATCWEIFWKNRILSAAIIFFFSFVFVSNFRTTCFVFIFFFLHFAAIVFFVGPNRFFDNVFYFVICLFVGGDGWGKCTNIWCDKIIYGK